MTAFIAPDLQVALVALLNDRPALADVQVSDGYPGDDLAEVERIWMGRSRSSELTPAGLKAGRTFYQEHGEFDVVIQVCVPGGSPVEVKARVQVLATEVAETVADNRTLGGVEGLNSATGSRWELSTHYLEAGTAAEVIYTVKYAARLT